MKKLDLSVFPEVSKKEWEFLAQKQLKGEDANESLKWAPFDGFPMLPYYELSDLQGLESQVSFFKSLPSHQWKLYQEVYVKNENEANKKAIDALMGGCDGIIFNIDTSFDSKELLSGINSEICDLSFINLTNRQLPVPEGRNVMLSENCIFQSKNISTPLEQIIEFVSSPKQGYFYRTSFTDFFLEIAALRALRFLLNKRLNNSTAKIHTHVPSHDNEDHQWFLNTTAGLASILGGSNSISFNTGIGDERISRNTGNLIREESGIESYQDQCGGSYYIEVLTSKLIEQALEKTNI